MKKLLSLTVFFCLALPTLSFSQTPLTKEEKVKAMYELNKKNIKTQDYSFIASWVFGNDKRAEVSQNEKTIQISDSNIEGVLSQLETNKSSIELKGNMQNYNAEFDDAKNYIAVTFTIGVYNAIIEVKPNGNAFLTLNSNGKKIVHYRGFVK
jgi:hypothetical protein